MNETDAEFTYEEELYRISVDPPSETAGHAYNALTAGCKISGKSDREMGEAILQTWAHRFQPLHIQFNIQYTMHMISRTISKARSNTQMQDTSEPWIRMQDFHKEIHYGETAPTRWGIFTTPDGIPTGDQGIATSTAWTWRMPEARAMEDIPFMRVFIPYIRPGAQYGGVFKYHIPGTEIRPGQQTNEQILEEIRQQLRTMEAMRRTWEAKTIPEDDPTATINQHGDAIHIPRIEDLPVRANVGQPRKPATHDDVVAAWRKIP